MINGSTINFLDFTQKVGDSRSKVFNGKFPDNLSEKRYWIGVVRLDNIRKMGHEVTISFIESESKRLTVDYFYQKNGAANQKVICGYNLQNKEVYDRLWKAREKGYKFFHMFLEESCTGGVFTVKLLCLSEERYKYGFPLKVLFMNLPEEKIKWLSEMKMTDFPTQIVLNTRPYC